MARILSGKEVAAALGARLGEEVAELERAGVSPALAILRVGKRDDACAYERGARKRCESAGIVVASLTLPEMCSQDDLMTMIAKLNADRSVHGILMLSPLPGHLDQQAATAALSPVKDVDAVTVNSLAHVFAGGGIGFSPCTAQSCMEILHHYGIDPAGKRAAVLGRSLVVGRPVAMMLLHENATPTICHSRTADAPLITREADIVIAAIGRAESVGPEYFRAGQTVIDVGTNWDDARGRLVGDVRFDEVEPIVEAITPVPGGVGSVTTTVLAGNVVRAACAQAGL